jgi:carbohydrate-selective porin OprB
VVTAGKFSLNDLFDNNTYSHDPRTQYLNWALMDNGAWDYAADTRGYTWGLAVEYRYQAMSFRFASVLEPKEANQMAMDTNLLQAHGDNGEVEYRYQLRNHPGVIRVLGYMNHANMGSYADAIANPADSGPDVTQSRAYRTKYGFGLNLEQELSPSVGVFSRMGWNDGRTETWAFTEIDSTFSVGASFRGEPWGRKDDNLGLALILNGLSADHRAYLAAGGQGFIIGDGSLNYAPEQILEAYYSLKLWRSFAASGDVQWVKNPAYNADRGSTTILALRAHYEL